MVSKILERLIQKQINNIILSFPPPYLCGFSTQKALVTLTGNWRISLDNKGFGGALLIHLSMAFDTLNHDLITARLHAYGLNMTLQNLLVITFRSDDTEPNLKRALVLGRIN